MARARAQFAWTQTASVLTMIANIHRDRKKKATAYRVEDFMPPALTEKRRIGGGVPLTKDNFEMLKQVFVKGIQP